MVNWESLGIGERLYDPSEIWRSFRLTEAEMRLVVQFGISGRYQGSFDALDVGDEIVLTSDDEDRGSLSRPLDVKLARIQACTAVWGEDESPGKIFEGFILGKPTDRDGGDEVFGFLFSNGRVQFIDSRPDSHYTDRMLQAAIILDESEVE